jgi:hypothetical protein
MRIKRGDHRPYAKIIGEITIRNYENEGMQLDKMKVMNPTIISEGDRLCSGSATGSCSTGATRRVTHLTIW